MARRFHAARSRLDCDCWFYTKIQIDQQRLRDVQCRYRFGIVRS